MDRGQRIPDDAIDLENLPADGDWAAYPGAPSPSVFHPVAWGRVVGIGAVCDLRPGNPNEPLSLDFSVSEFVRLDDGRHVTLHDERGFTTYLHGAADSADPWEYETLESVTSKVLTTVLPDDDESGEDHPWWWLAELAQDRGLSVTEADLRALPYEVVFTFAVRRRLAATD